MAGGNREREMRVVVGGVPCRAVLQSGACSGPAHLHPAACTQRPRAPPPRAAALFRDIAAGQVPQRHASRSHPNRCAAAAAPRKSGHCPPLYRTSFLARLPALAPTSDCHAGPPSMRTWAHMTHHALVTPSCPALPAPSALLALNARRSCTRHSPCATPRPFDDHKRTPPRTPPTGTPAGGTPQRTPPRTPPGARDGALPATQPNRRCSGGHAGEERGEGSDAERRGSSRR